VWKILVEESHYDGDGWHWTIYKYNVKVEEGNEELAHEAWAAAYHKYNWIQ